MCFVLSDHRRDEERRSRRWQEREQNVRGLQRKGKVSFFVEKLQDTDPQTLIN